MKVPGILKGQIDQSFNCASRKPRGFFEAALALTLFPCLLLKHKAVMCPLRTTVRSLVTKPLPKDLQTPILRRAAVLKQRTVHRWRHHMLLGKKHAFLRASSLYNYWLSFFAVSLCFISGTWAHSHLTSDTGISLTAIIVATSFPLEFIALFIGLLSMYLCTVN